ncbi:hypothetical protein DLJ59_15270 [Micromonospora inaquosa]|uniref:Uncharacterized protein n=1 Tax=Micromonospora inaquosa TaxID=2203716 RepID=A0A3N9X578_9ACTN|nr:hypothetical protein DLJ59_15270 [Micromonospora inaquosa]
MRQPLTCPASAPKPSRPGPGRPPGHRNTHPIARYDVHIRPPPTPRHRLQEGEDRQSPTTPHRLKIKSVLLLTVSPI